MQFFASAVGFGQEAYPALILISLISTSEVGPPGRAVDIEQRVAEMAMKHLIGHRFFWVEDLLNPTG